MSILSRRIAAVPRALGLSRDGPAGGAGAAGWRRLYLSALFGVFDQGIASLANLGAGLLVIRTSTKDEYGLYSIGYMLVMLSIGVSGGLFSAQSVVAYYDKSPELRARYVASMLLGQTVLIAPLCLLISLALYCAELVGWIDPGVGEVLIGAALVAPAAMAHDYMRSYFYIETVRYAALISAVHCITWLLLAIVGHQLGIPTFIATLAAYGLATSMSSTIGLRLAHLPIISAIPFVVGSVRDAWHHGKWAVMGVVISAVQNQSQVYLLGLMAGPAQVANVNATRLLYGPLTMLLGGVNQILLPRLVELRSNRAYSTSMRLTYKFILVIFPIVVAYALLLHSMIDFLSEHVLRRRFDNVHALIAAWAMSFVLATFSSAFSSQMIAAKRFRALMILNLATALGVVAIDVVLIPRMQALGSMIGLVGGQLAFILLLWRAVREATRTESVHALDLHEPAPVMQPRWLSAVMPVCNTLLPPPGVVPLPSVETITTESGLQALAPEWDALCATLSPRLPFFTPLWNLLYWKHLRRNSMAVRDDLRCFAVRDADGTLLAVAPMMLCTWPAVGWPRARQLRYFGADPNITECNGLICRPGRYQEALEAVTAELHARAGEWDWSHWGGVPANEAGAAWLRDILLPGTEWLRTSYYLDLPGDWESFRASRPRNIKESLRKCYNSLKRDGHEFVFRVVSEPAEVQAALDVFYVLHNARAAADGFSIRHKDVFEQPHAAAFLNEYAAEMARAGRLFIFQMVIAGEVVATRIGFGLGTDLYLYFSGYKPEWGRYSVMTTTLAETLKWCTGTPYRRVNLSFGTDVSKMRWKPTEYSYVSGLMAAPTLRGTMSCRMYRSLRAWRARGSQPTGVRLPPAGETVNE